MLKTEIIKIEKDIDMVKLRYAARVLREGGLVAFPTETVYGLGADALNPDAVDKIFKAKGRPGDNPLIVHVGSGDIGEIVKHVPLKAKLLMDKFWPGPLTMVLQKSSKVPRIISGGLPTVAVRMPLHPVALALIRESGVPVAAPSANISGKPSPTTGKHVIEDLFGKVDVIIEGDNCEIGVESTVVDMTSDIPMILRPGGITLEQLREIMGEVSLDPTLLHKITGELIPKSPGMKYTHYSPDAQVIIVEGDMEKVTQKINELSLKYEKEGKKVGVLATLQTKELYKNKNIILMGDRTKPETIASNLFGTLREFDNMGVEIILAESVENTGMGFAVMNRMKKAAGYNIVNV